MINKLNLFSIYSTFMISFLYKFSSLFKALISFINKIKNYNIGTRIQQLQKLYKFQKSFLFYTYFKNRMAQDAQQARYLRKKYAEQGVDEDQQQEQKQFGKNLQQALQTYGKKGKNKNLQSQVQYFGHAIQPFNMRDDQQMGNIDQSGFFVFKRKNQYRDAWLDSIQEGNDQMLADKIKKRIKTEGMGYYKGIYDEDKQQQKPNHQNRIPEEQNQDQQNDSQEDQQQQKDNQSSPHVQEQPTGLQPTQIKMLLCQLLPHNKSANTYIKQLKKNIKNEQNKQLHDKILELCNMYIEKTNQYDILTLKKEQLEIQLQSGEEKSEEINWDEQQEEQQERDDKKIDQKREDKNKNKMNEKQKSKVQHPVKQDNHKQIDAKNYEDDDIF